ncbi:hypothetical protein AB5N19_02960 [Seiridium cardinale]
MEVLADMADPWTQPDPELSDPKARLRRESLFDRLLEHMSKSELRCEITARFLNFETMMKATSLRIFQELHKHPGWESVSEDCVEWLVDIAIWNELAPEKFKDAFPWETDVPNRNVSAQKPASKRYRAYIQKESQGTKQPEASNQKLQPASEKAIKATAREFASDDVNTNLRTGSKIKSRQKEIALVPVQTIAQRAQDTCDSKRNNHELQAAAKDPPKKDDKPPSQTKDLRKDTAEETVHGQQNAPTGNSETSRSTMEESLVAMNTHSASKTDVARRRLTFSKDSRADDRDDSHNNGLGEELKLLQDTSITDLDGKIRHIRVEKSYMYPAESTFDMENWAPESEGPHPCERTPEQRMDPNLVCSRQKGLKHFTGHIPKHRLINCRPFEVPIVMDEKDVGRLVIGEDMKLLGDAIERFSNAEHVKLVVRHALPNGIKNTPTEFTKVLAIDLKSNKISAENNFSVLVVRQIWQLLVGFAHINWSRIMRGQPPVDLVTAFNLRFEQEMTRYSENIIQYENDESQQSWDGFMNFGRNYHVKRLRITSMKEVIREKFGTIEDIEERNRKAVAAIPGIIEANPWIDNPAILAELMPEFLYEGGIDERKTSIMDSTETDNMVQFCDGTNTATPKPHKCVAGDIEESIESTKEKSGRKPTTGSTTKREAESGDERGGEKRQKFGHEGESSG